MRCRFNTYRVSTASKTTAFKSSAGPVVRGRYAWTIQSRSEVTYAITCAAVNGGLSKEWLLQQLLNPRNKGGAKLREIAQQGGK